MRKELVPFLELTPARKSLQLEVFSEDAPHILEGVLRTATGFWYPIRDGVPSFLTGALRPDLQEFRQRHGLPSCDPRDDFRIEQTEQAKTTVTFSDKWRRFKNYGIEPAHQSFLFDWYCKKLGLQNIEELKAFYRTKDLILEIGPGSGFNTRFMAEHTRGTVIAADISDAAYTTFANTCHLPNCHVLQADLMELPLEDNLFDFVIADGVLHHTPNTRQAVKALYRKVKPGGQFFFYVYRKMGPARYFADQHIRQQFSKLEPEACYQACEAITELGRELSKLNASITLTRPIPILGIPAGTHSVQRLFYYNFLKCFWNDAFDFETNNMVNFDWYHPHHAWQHSQDEVASWLQEFGVTEYSFQPANPNGISVLLTKPVAQAAKLAG